MINLTKEDASKQVGMKKKTLDDYLMFLRLGIANYYDFEHNINQKFNQLRSFIKSIPNRAHWDK